MTTQYRHGCPDCRFCNVYVLSPDPDFVCENPAAVAPDKGRRGIVPTCDIARGKSWPCGPYGLLFQDKRHVSAIKGIARLLGLR